ncbi:exonuclease domain-containing protein [Treponema pallidum]|uniref:DNA polymerase III subunit epsilon n=4 Tax=Treponema pallidum TaxID=160 RepID=DPO3E_TREPA|nr:exonuclease domain-containing protein [Treponema pallidum]O83649.1 RecName: Full=DNA polymerase III subunit epsilon [Treponema pallidum subsp. pallidum str. Nichols]AAC65617.1 DNA polymerase III, subunit epsilon (dnaQ) [Treponema pallidum subsp. pallidum str. Nichols]ACD71061.1 DNA polymerase III, subunit epsilon [Treponema pallidum subsp. pallidum SS14]ADD72748.1 DNA polymerase III subunit epsilon [Treponema pallidum subsp. pallidum str. Chicago]AEZ57768.1 DNA-directed DNA polymerase III e
MIYDWVFAVHEHVAFTAFDTETTGLKAEEDRIIEIGAVTFDRKGIIARFSTLIFPDRAIPPDVSKINHITDDMLVNKPRFCEIVSDFSRFIKGTVLVAHNANFDVEFLNAELSLCKKQPLSHKVVDTYAMAQAVFPGLGRHQYRLQNLALQFGLTVHAAHRAEDDARVCMELFTTMIAHHAKQNGHCVNHAQSPTIKKLIQEIQASSTDCSQELF